jgi:hypothetical protein
VACLAISLISVKKRKNCKKKSGNAIIATAHLRVGLVALFMKNHARKLPQLEPAIDVGEKAITHQTVMLQRTRRGTV